MGSQLETLISSKDEMSTCNSQSQEHLLSEVLGQIIPREKNWPNLLHTDWLREWVPQRSVHSVDLYSAIRTPTLISPRFVLLLESKSFCVLTLRQNWWQLGQLGNCHDVFDLWRNCHDVYDLWKSSKRQTDASHQSRAMFNETTFKSLLYFSLSFNS